MYQYFYEGQRPGEYVFSISSDRKTWFSTSVIVTDATVGSWEQMHARALSSNERYAVAKMALFQAFDQLVSPPT